MFVETKVPVECKSFVSPGRLVFPVFGWPSANYIIDRDIVTSRDFIGRKLVSGFGAQAPWLRSWSWVGTCLKNLQICRYEAPRRFSLLENAETVRTWSPFTTGEGACATLPWQFYTKNGSQPILYL